MRRTTRRSEAAGIAKLIIEDLMAEGVPPSQLAIAFSKQKAEIEAAIQHACVEVGLALKKNPNAGRDYLAGLLKEMEEQ